MYIYICIHTHIYKQSLIRVYVKCLLYNLLEVYLIKCYSDCLWGRGGESEEGAFLVYHLGTIHVLSFHPK